MAHGQKGERIALGAIVLIRVFASQLANKMWDLVNGEIKIKKTKRRRVSVAAGEDIDNAVGGG